jgi:hypothetical protein
VPNVWRWVVLTGEAGRVGLNWYGHSVKTKRVGDIGDNRSLLWIFAIAVLGLVLTAAQAVAQNEEDLAKKLANPVASLISIPLDLDYDENIGPADDGDRLALIAKPVVPITLNPTWNLISRTIVPLVHQDDVLPRAGDQTGLGDILQSLFFSPAKPTKGGLIWGAGPVILLSTATDDLLGSEKWAIGPTGVVLKQNGSWTYGILANHLWDVAGDDDRADINNTFLQPFVSYTTTTAWSYSLQTESTYSWENEDWSVPVNFAVSKLTKLGKLPVQYKAGVRYWADSPRSGPEGGWGRP